MDTFFPEVLVTKLRVSAPAPYKNPTVTTQREKSDNIRIFLLIVDRLWKPKGVGVTDSRRQLRETAGSRWGSWFHRFGFSLLALPYLLGQQCLAAVCYASPEL